MDKENDQIQDGAKTVLGIRVPPVLKSELYQEADKIGVPVSELGLNILLNRKKDKDEIEKLKQLVSERDKKNEELNLQIMILKGKHHDALEKTKRESAAQLKQLQERITGNDPLKDERLLYLFENLEGTTDRIKDAYGKDFDVTYNSPMDVLRTLIYGTKLNQ